MLFSVDTGNPVPLNSSDASTAVSQRTATSGHHFSVLSANTRDDSTLPLQQESTDRFPSNQLQDAVPQLPIRKESASIHSSLFDLDPQDSLPQVPTRQASDRILAAARRRTQLRDQSSNDSPMPLGPPTSVTIPQDSGVWSAGVSTLMSRDDDDDISASVPPQCQDDSDAALMQSGTEDALPWDKIAIGLPENGAGRKELWHNPSPKESPPMLPPRRFNPGPSGDDSQGTLSYPSFHYASSSEPSSGDRSSDLCTIDPLSPRCAAGEASNHLSPLHLPLAPPSATNWSSSRPSTATRNPSNAAMLRATRASFQQATSSGARFCGTVPASANLPKYPKMPADATTPATLERQESRSLPTTSPLRASTNEPYATASQPRNYPSTTALAASSPRRVAPPAGKSIMIEVAPGVNYTLRGSEETWKAIEDGRITVTRCVFCQIEINCLEDAQLVVCPDCTMISPVDQTNDGTDAYITRHGVGVGVKPEDVIRWIQRNM